MMEDYLARVAAIMRARGWAVQTVHGGASAPPFAYTVGLTNFDRHPELVIVGVDHETAAAILDELSRRVQAGERLTAGQRLEGLDETEYPMVLLAVTDPASHLVVARRLLGEELTALQVVWPDPDGRFPWDAAHDPRFLVMQPLLGPTPSGLSPPAGQGDPQRPPEVKGAAGLAVYVPAPGRLAFIDRGSGIVGTTVAAGQVLIDYDSNRVGAVNLVTYADRVANAHDRQAHRAPISARAQVDEADLHLVGWFDPELGVVTVEDLSALAAWLGADAVAAEELRTTWDVHVRRRSQLS
jgi:Domain of unknown function (DUF4262)